MGLTVVKAEGASIANQAISLWVQSTTGWLSDPLAVSWQLFGPDGGQVWPAAAGTSEDLDLTASRVSSGHYCATWNSSAAVVGRYTVRWSVTTASERRVFDQELEVVGQAYSGAHYCTVADLRVEGLTPARFPERAAQMLIVKASKYVERFTGRVFGAIAKTVRLDGTNARALLLNEPIVALDPTVLLIGDLVGEPSTLEPESLLVYNRHLSQGLLDPDDREAPKIEFAGDGHLYCPGCAGLGVRRWTQGIWPKGRQNVQVSGLFGFTEVDGSWVGGIPELIREATKMLCFRTLDKMGSAGRDDSMKRGRLLSEFTRDQGYTLQKSASSAVITGDPEIDNILVAFSRPPRFGAA